jgi:hypothetical protein
MELFLKNKIKLPKPTPLLVLAPVVKQQQTACFRYYGNVTGVATGDLFVKVYVNISLFKKTPHFDFFTFKVTRRVTGQSFVCSMVYMGTLSSRNTT